MKRSLKWAGASALFAGGILMAFSFAPTLLAAEQAGFKDSEQVSKLLAETKTTAVQLKSDALTMESFRRMNVSAQSHATAINQIKADINELGKQVAKLKGLEYEASPWQTAAIERIYPYLDELSGYTTAAIERLSGDRTHTLADYDDYLQANADNATNLAAMLGEFVDFGNARVKAEQLSGRLEVR
jgi:hypothetical protein